MIGLRVNNIVNEIMIRHENDPIPEISQEIERLESVTAIAKIMCPSNDDDAIIAAKNKIKMLEEPVLLLIKNLAAAKIFLRNLESERVESLKKTISISYSPNSTLAEHIDAALEYVSNLNDPGIEIKKEKK